MRQRVVRAAADLLRLSWPLVVTYSLQAVIGFTDAWFAARVSHDALAGLGAQTFLNLALFLLLGGAAFAVQVPVASACGAGRGDEAHRYLGAGLAAAALTLPLFAVAAALGPWLFTAWGLPPAVAAQAGAYWQPRMWGGVAVVALYAVSSYLTGAGQTRAALAANATAAVANVPLNEALVFGLGLGLAGSAHASTLASAAGAAVGLCFVFGSGRVAARWRDGRRALRELAVTGVPIGVSASVDVLGFAVFQLMMARLGAAEGAATLLLLALTGLAFWPALGLASGCTTLIAHRAGAGRLDEVKPCVQAALWLMGGWMLLVSLAMLLWGPAVMGAMLAETSAQGQAALALAGSLLGIAAAYQVFDAVNLASAFALRGLGDVTWAAAVGSACTFALFLPLAAWLSFEPGGLGWGARGGWLAAALFSALLAAAYHWRLAVVMRRRQVA